jgi:hypothetical protein
MNENLPASEQRDLNLRRARRARIGVLSAGVLGSLGVAAAVGIPALQAQSTSAPGVATTPDDQSSFSQWLSGQSQTLGEHDQAGPGRDDEGGARGDDGEQQVDPRAQQQQQQSPPPGLQQGFGPSHGSTGGS